MLGKISQVLSQRVPNFSLENHRLHTCFDTAPGPRTRAWASKDPREAAARNQCLETWCFFWRKNIWRSGGVLCKKIGKSTWCFFHMFRIYKLHKNRVQPTLNLEAQIYILQHRPAASTNFGPLLSRFCAWESLCGTSHSGDRLARMPLRHANSVYSTYRIYHIHFATDCLLSTWFCRFLHPCCLRIFQKGLLKKAMVTWKYLHNRTLHKASISHPTGSSENHRLYSTKSCQVAPSPSSCMTYSLKRAHCNKSAGKNTKNEDWPTGPQSRLGKNVS